MEARLAALETSVAAIIPTAPSGEVFISGTPAEDQVLKVDGHTIVDPNVLDNGGIPLVTYYWQRMIVDGGVQSLIGSGSTYTLTQGDVGYQIRAVAHYVDNIGTQENVFSDRTDTIQNVEDQPTGTVAILSNTEGT